jgi:amino acid adenylation domain-containing protein
MITLDKKNIQDIRALLPLQEGILAHYVNDPFSELYFEQLCLEITGIVDPGIFEKAWNTVVENNEMLRTLFQWEKLKKPVAVILRKHKIKLAYYDLFGLENDKRNKTIEEIKSKDRKEKFNLGRVPFRVTLCKCEENHYLMIINHHHILFDGWSTGIILKEFLSCYNDLFKAIPPRSPRKTSFKEFILWMQNQDKNRGKNFWTAYLCGVEKKYFIPMGQGKKDKKVEEGYCKITFTASFARELEEFAGKNKVTLASLLYAAWGILLSRYKDSSDIVFGTTVSGRNANIKGIEDSVGLFINTLPLRIKTSPDFNVLELVDHINCDNLVREEYAHTPLVDIKTYGGFEPNEDLFDSIFVLENYPLDKILRHRDGVLVINSFSAKPYLIYDLTVVVTVFENIDIELFFNKCLFSQEGGKKILCHFERITREIVEAPHRKIKDIIMLREAERKQLLDEFNDTEPGYPADKTVFQLFSEQVKKTPDNTAVVDETRFISYRELDDRANRLAVCLRKRGITADVMVGIMMRRSIDLIIGILGIIKSGGAYLSIDPDYPRERIDYMLKDSSARILVSDLSEVNQVSGETEMIDLPRLIAAIENAGPTCSIHPDHLCYVIYTSGSTGRPKGVLVRHRGLINLVYYHKKVFSEDQDSRMSQVANLSFDAMAFEVWPCLLNGAALDIAGNDIRLHPLEMKKWLIRKGITISFQPTVMFQQLLKEDWDDEGIQLRHLRCAGDKLNNYPRRNYPFRLYNLYGPTEDTIWTTWQELTVSGVNREGEVPTIGRPIANHRVFIINRDFQLQPIGIPGELCIGGDGAARGYLNRPELTAEKFREYRSYRTYRTYISYKTGDLARWMANGEIEFLGRVDNQVKIRGFRIELEEIETAILTHQAVKDVSITVRENQAGGKQLIGYLVLHDGYSIKEIAAYLQEKLPVFMLPAYFVQLNEIPLTPAGKKSRNALIELKEVEHVILDTGWFEKVIVRIEEIEHHQEIIAAYYILKKEYEACSASMILEKIRDRLPNHLHPARFTPIESLPRDHGDNDGNVDNSTFRDSFLFDNVIAAWKETLSLSSIRKMDNFFEIGGNSILAAMVSSKLSQKLNTRVPLELIFEHPILQDFCREIEKNENNPSPREEIKEYPKKRTGNRFPMSMQQESIWFFEQLNPGTPAYVSWLSIEFKKDFSGENLKRALAEMMKRHELLRTVFLMEDGTPIQKVLDRIDLYFETIDISELPEVAGEEKIELISKREAMNPFNMSEGPLLKSLVFKLDSHRHKVVFLVHHIIWDAISNKIFLEELHYLYHCFNSGVIPTLPAIEVQYGDYACWQRDKINTSAFESEQRFWLDKLKGVTPLSLSGEVRDTGQQPHPGEAKVFRLPGELAGEIKKLALEENATNYMVLLAAFCVLLYRHTGMDDIVMGVPFSTRTAPELNPLIGYFIATYPIRLDLSGNPTFKELIHRTREVSHEVMAHLALPVEAIRNIPVLKEELKNRNLYNIVFSLNDVDYTHIPGVKLDPAAMEIETAKFEMVFGLHQIGKNIHCRLVYSKKIYTTDFIDEFIANYTLILKTMLKYPGMSILEEFSSVKSEMQEPEIAILTEKSDFFNFE